MKTLVSPNWPIRGDDRAINVLTLWSGMVESTPLQMTPPVKKTRAKEGTKLAGNFV